MTRPCTIPEAGDSDSPLSPAFAPDRLRNKNTRAAYSRNSGRFLAWASSRGLSLSASQSHHISTYLDELAIYHAPSSVGQHLSALRDYFDRLVSAGILGTNPALDVRRITQARSRSKRPRASAEDARRLLMSIEAGITGSRDRAVIASIVFSPARLGELIALNVADYHNSQHLGLILGPGGDGHRILGDFMDAYVTTAGIIEDSEGPLFRTIGRSRLITDMRITRNDTFRMVRRRGRAAGLPPSACCCRALRAAALN